MTCSEDYDDDQSDASDDSDLAFLDDMEVLTAVRTDFPRGPHDLKTILEWGVGFYAETINAGLRYRGVSLNDMWFCTMRSPSGVRKLGHVSTQYGNQRVMRGECALGHKFTDASGILRRCRCSLGFENNAEGLKDSEGKIFRWTWSRNYIASQK